MTTPLQDFNPVPIDWQLALNQNLFALYQTDLSDQPKLAESYDFVLTIGDFTIFVLTAWQRCLQIEDFDTLKRYHTRLANELIHKHNRGLSALDDNFKQKLADAEKCHPERYDHKNLPKVFFVGLLGLSTVFEDGNEYFVDYDLNDRFFYEECVFDLDNSSTVLQVFTLKDWHNLLSFVPSPSDFCAFLKYYRQALVEQTPFPSAVWLAEQFLLHPVFFDRVRQVSKQLENLSLTSDSTMTDTEAKRQQQLSMFWQKAVERVIKRQQDAGASVDWRVVRRLIMQCGYTRLKIVEFVTSFANADPYQRQEGLVRQVHSYHHIGQHFVLVVYGADPNSELSMQNILRQYQAILKHIDQNLEGQGIDDLFLLGFDLSQVDEVGDTIVQMDVFYQQSQWARPRKYRDEL